MSDIFISYKREEQDKARQLADALEKQGWSVWWDPKLRTGEYFDDVIEQALKEARCVIVMWSKRSVKSRYVIDESSYALKYNKLIPVAIEEVELSFRFSGIQTTQLIGWDGSEEFPAFKRLVDDMSAILGQPVATKPVQAAPASERADSLTTSRVLRDTLNDGTKGPEMVLIQGGEFFMGSDPSVDSYAADSEQPRHRVTIEAFYIGKYPVMFTEYDAFAQATGREQPNDEGWGRDGQPVINVSWEDAESYCKWLSEKTGTRYRLSTEAEWEYAARARTETPWYWGNNEEHAGDYAWFNTNSDGHTHVVGGKQPNDFGLHDMAGNVWEWVQDCWHDNYHNAPNNGRAWLEGDGGDCVWRVVRGGSWGFNVDLLRSAGRNWGNLDDQDDRIGFRLVCRRLSSVDH